MCRLCAVATPNGEQLKEEEEVNNFGIQLCFYFRTNTPRGKSEEHPVGLLPLCYCVCCRVHLLNRYNFILQKPEQTLMMDDHFYIYVYKFSLNSSQTADCCLVTVILYPVIFEWVSSKISTV